MVYTGTINLTQIKRALDAKQISTFTGEKGDKYINIAIFLNELQDKYGNDGAVKCQPIKDGTDHKVYIGNFKKAGSKPSQIEVKKDDDDLPF